MARCGKFDAAVHQQKSELELSGLQLTRLESQFGGIDHPSDNLNSLVLMER